jgi:hypothetical protein
LEKLVNLETLDNEPATNRTVQERERKRDNPEPYKGEKGSNYLAREGFDMECGTWTELETTVLIVIQHILSRSQVEVNSTNISSLYRSLASSTIVQETKLAIGQKRNAQIVGKLAHLHHSKNVYLRLAENTT